MIQLYYTGAGVCFLFAFIAFELLIAMVMGFWLKWRFSRTQTQVAGQNWQEAGATREEISYIMRNGVERRKSVSCWIPERRKS